MIFTLNEKYKIEKDATSDTGLRLDTTPNGSFVISINASTFDLSVKSGKMNNMLCKWMTVSQAKDLARSLLEAIEDYEKRII